MVQSTLEMSGLEKASVLLMSLRSETSNEVLKRLTPEQCELLGAQIVKMRHVRAVTRQRVLDEVTTSVREIRQKNSREDGDIDSEPPLRWLEKRDPAEVAELLSQERPHNAALVIAHLSPNGAANVLPLLDENSRNQVTHRLATMGPVSAEAVKAADEVMRERLLNRSADGEPGRRPSQAPLGGPAGAAIRARESVLSAILAADSIPFESGTTSSRSPEDLVLMPTDELKVLLARLETDDLCLALKVASSELKSAVLANVPDHVEQVLRRSLEGPPQLKVREIEAAQRRIMNVLCGAAEDETVGDAALSREGAE